MKILKLNVEASEQAMTRNESGAMVPKTTKDGKQLYYLYFFEEKTTQIGDRELLSKELKRISSEIDLKPGQHLVEIEEYVIDNKVYNRAIKVFKP